MTKQSLTVNNGMDYIWNFYVQEMAPFHTVFYIAFFVPFHTLRRVSYTAGKATCFVQNT